MMKKFFSLFLLLSLSFVGSACAMETLKPADATPTTPATVATTEAQKASDATPATPAAGKTVEAPKNEATPAAKPEAPKTIAPATPAAPEKTTVENKSTAKIEAPKTDKKQGRCGKALGAMCALPGAILTAANGHRCISGSALALLGLAALYNYSETFRNFVVGSDDDAAN